MDLMTLMYNVLMEKIITNFLNLLCIIFHQTWLVPVLAVLLIGALVALKNQDSLREKLYIDGKSYYDIMLDLLYFSRNKAPNKCKFDTLEWDFICTYNPENRDFLDIEEKWTIHFSSIFSTVGTLKLGIYGGNPSDLQKEAATAHQEGIPLNLPEPWGLTGKDCESIDFPLASDVKRGKSSKVTVSFVWQKFIVVNRKDDYFYFLPKALSNQVDEFHIKVQHPYNCEPVVYLLKRNWTSNYIKTQITKENESKCKASFGTQTPMEFEFTIKGLGALDVVLIIFNKSSQ